MYESIGGPKCAVFRREYQALPQPVTLESIVITTKGDVQILKRAKQLTVCLNIFFFQCWWFKQYS